MKKALKGKMGSIIGLFSVAAIGIGMMTLYSPVTLEEELVPQGPVYVLDARSMEIISTIRDFETWAQETPELQERSDRTTAINDITLGLIRHKRYGDGLSGLQAGVWRKMAGPASNNTVPGGSEAVEFQEKLMALEGFKDPVTGKGIDFAHMVAVVDVYSTDLPLADNAEIYYDLLLSTGGDLETFLIDAARHKSQGKTIDSSEIYRFSKSTIGGQEKSYFDGADYLADIDGQNLAERMQTDNLLLSEALLRYYQEGDAANRQEQFMAYYGGEAGFEARINSFMTSSPLAQDAADEKMVEFMESFKSIKSLMISTLEGDIDNLSDTDRKAVTLAFTDMVKNR